MSVQAGVNQVIGGLTQAAMLSPGLRAKREAAYAEKRAVEAEKAELSHIETSGQRIAAQLNKLAQTPESADPVREYATRSQLQEETKNLSELASKRARMNPTKYNIDKAQEIRVRALQTVQYKQDFARQHKELLKDILKAEDNPIMKEKPTGGKK